MSDAYQIIDVVKIPTIILKNENKSWLKGYTDLLVFTSRGTIFYFKRIPPQWGFTLVEKKKEWSVRVWRTKARGKSGKLMMELSITNHYNPFRKVNAGKGFGKQELCTISESELPALKERVVMECI